MRSEIYKDDGYKLMGAAFEVYNERGYGLGEEIYQECMEIELELRSIPFIPKHELRLIYKGRQLETKYLPDLFVFNWIVVELKAVTQLISEHEARLFNYLRIASQPVGYLMNFGEKTELAWKRFILDDLRARVE